MSGIGDEMRDALSNFAKGVEEGVRSRDATIAALADALERACDGWETWVREADDADPQLADAALARIESYRELAHKAKETL